MTFIERWNALTMGNFSIFMKILIRNVLSGGISIGYWMIYCDRFKKQWKMN